MISSLLFLHRGFQSAANVIHSPFRRLFSSLSGVETNTRIFESLTHDPWYNLATEEWIFRDLDPSFQTLFLWRNGPTVVIGRNQNPWKECHLQNMERDGVHLARRRSGGGAVYQDLGNTNFTFLSPRSGYSKERNMGIIINGLKKLGVTAECSGRNDILCEGKKISGSAFKLAHDRAFHHGTMLLSVDMSAMSKYLNPNKLKLESKGVKSVQARVMNLTELVPGLTHEAICETIRESFEEEYRQKTNVVMLGDVPENNPYYKELKDWDWRFGETPHFTYELETRFDWGMMDVHIESDQGVIIKCRIFSDSLFPDMIDVIANALVKKSFDADGIERAMKEAAFIVQSEDERTCIKDFEEWLKLTM